MKSGDIYMLVVLSSVLCDPNCTRYLERQKAREARATENEEVDPDAPVSAPRETDTVVMEAYASEIFTLEQLMLYLRKLVPEGAADKAGASAEEKKALEAPQGGCSTR